MVTTSRPSQGSPKVRAETSTHPGLCRRLVGRLLTPSGRPAVAGQPTLLIAIEPAVEVEAASRVKAAAEGAVLRRLAASDTASPGRGTVETAAMEAAAAVGDCRRLGCGRVHRACVEEGERVEPVDVVRVRGVVVGVVLDGGVGEVER